MFVDWYNSKQYYSESNFITAAIEHTGKVEEIMECKFIS